MNEFKPSAYTEEFINEMNIIKLCFNKKATKNVLKYISQYLKTYNCGLSIHNNPYTDKYYEKTKKQKIYYYNGHGHPFSIMIRILCGGDIIIKDKMFKKHLKKIKETANIYVADISEIIRYVTYTYDDLKEEIKKPGDFLTLYYMLNKSIIKANKVETTYRCMCAGCTYTYPYHNGNFSLSRDIRIENGNSHYVNKYSINVEIAIFQNETIHQYYLKYICIFESKGHYELIVKNKDKWLYYANVFENNDVVMKCYELTTNELKNLKKIISYLIYVKKPSN
tara:strand:+ start:583 stop:1422 length:840 start_codon:yes stop_codon:yes gene_type:complete